MSRIEFNNGKGYTCYILIILYMPQDLKSRIANFEVFRNLAEQDIAEFTRVCVARKFRKGQTIFVPGEDRERVFLVVSGEVKIYQISGGKKITIDVHREGGFFGDLTFAHSAFQGKPANFAEGLTDTELCVINSYDLADFLKKYPSFALSIVVVLRNKLHHAESKIRDLALSAADVRIVNELIRYSVKHGKDKGDHFEIHERLTHQELSEMTGLARETVTKVLNALVKSGMIEFSQDKLIKLNKEKIITDCLDCLKLESPNIFE